METLNLKTLAESHTAKNDKKKKNWVSDFSTLDSNLITLFSWLLPASSNSAFLVHFLW